MQSKKGRGGGIKGVVGERSLPGSRKGQLRKTNKGEACLLLRKK